jgi:hypothetical protein
LNSDLYDQPKLSDALLPALAELPYYAELARQALGNRTSGAETPDAMLDKNQRLGTPLTAEFLGDIRVRTSYFFNPVCHSETMLIGKLADAPAPDGETITKRCPSAVTSYKCPGPGTRACSGAM